MKHFFFDLEKNIGIMDPKVKTLGFFFPYHFPENPLCSLYSGCVNVRRPDMSLYMSFKLQIFINWES